MILHKPNLPAKQNSNKIQGDKEYVNTDGYEVPGFNQQSKHRVPRNIARKRNDGLQTVQAGAQMSSPKHTTVTPGGLKVNLKNL